ARLLTEGSFSPALKMSCMINCLILCTNCSYIGILLLKSRLNTCTPPTLTVLFDIIQLVQVFDNRFLTKKPPECRLNQASCIPGNSIKIFFLERMSGTAVDIDGNSADVCCKVGTQERNDIGRFLCITNAAE